MIRVETIDKNNNTFKISIDKKFIENILKNYNRMSFYNKLNLEMEECLYPDIVYSNTMNILKISENTYKDIACGIVKVSNCRLNDFFDIINNINEKFTPRRIDI